MKYTFFAAVGTMALMTSCGGSGSGELKDHRDSLSYAVGISIGQSLKESEISDIDYATFMKAMEDFRDSSEVMDIAAADEFIRNEFMRVQESKNEKFKVDGEKFMEENKGKSGVQTTASGLQYKVMTEGTGIKPDANDSVTVHYHGTLPDGTVFDSSVERGEPVTFTLNRVIPGWTEGVQLMSEGSKYTMYVPQELGYGTRGSQSIPPYSPLVFEVELIKVTKND